MPPRRSLAARAAYALALLPLLALPARAAAQGLDPIIALLREARRAGDAGEHPRALALVDSAARLAPEWPNVVLNRLVALARAGRTEAAVAQLRRLLAWDARYARRALADSALAAAAPALRAALAPLDVDTLAARADRPVARARAWAAIAERDLVPEGTAWDPATRSLLVGSLNKHKVVAVAPDGTVRDRVPAGTRGLASVVGIHVDARRGTLWVTSNARYDRQSDTTSSALYAFDAATGAFRSRHPLPEGGPHFLNDLTTGRDGTVYVTDTRAGRVWTLRPGAAALAPYAPLGALLSPNGITISDDGRDLFVADAERVRAVDVATGRVRSLAAPESVSIGGVDGLAYVRDARGEALVAHQPLGYWRVARYPLDARRGAVVGRELIESASPDSRTSTTGEVVGGEYLFLGNTQIDRMNAGTVDAATMAPVRLYRVALAAAPRRGVVAVALAARDSVVVLDAQTLDRVATLPVGNEPHEVSASPDGRRAYVADAGDSSVTVVALDASGGAPRVAATWRLPDLLRAHDVSASADGRTVWAVSGSRRVLLELDAATGRARRRVPIAVAGSWMVDAGAARGPVVVASLDSGGVTLVDAATGRGRTLPARVGEADAVTTPDGREVWSVNVNDGRVTVFDAASGRVLARDSSGRSPGRVLFTPDGRHALVVDDGDSTVKVLDARTRARVATIAVPAGPKVIALSPDGRRAYVTHPDRGALTMIDVPAAAVLRTVPLPGTPDGVAVLEQPR